SRASTPWSTAATKTASECRWASSAAASAEALPAVRAIPPHAAPEAAVVSPASVTLPPDTQKSGVTVLVVDDDQANLDSVCRIFQREGLSTLAAPNGSAALELLRKPEVGVMVTDLMMPGVDGQELLKAARAMRPDVEVVLMTAYATVETAVAAMRDGAYDFITKPLKRHSLVKAVQKAMEKQALVAENRDLKAQLAALGPRSLVGSSPSFRAFLALLRQAAPSTATVLLMGESGTG